MTFSMTAMNAIAVLLTSSLLVASSAVADDVPGVTLAPMTLAQWPDQLASYQPDVVVVDMWATWCESCIKGFPKMVALDRQYGESGVTMVSMLLEDPDEPGVIDMAEGFLTRQEATFDNFWMNENLMESFAGLDLVGLPAVLIYDGEGKLRFKLTGDDPNNQFEDDDVEAAIVQLMGESQAE